MDAIAYIRISTKDQSAYSLENQERNVRLYCQQNKLNLIALFTDDGESSYTFDRPDWQALEKFIRKNKSVKYLIILDHDRFSRNLAEALLKIKELHDKFGIKVLATTDSFQADFSDPTAFMMRAFKFMMAESELWRIRERTKAGMVQAAMNGRYISQAPMGYTNARDAENKPVLVIDEEKAFLVRLIFKEYNSGKGVEEVRRIAAAYGFTRKGSSAVQEVLTNPVYAGLIRIPAHKGNPETIGKGLHKALVTEADYWRARSRLTEKKITKQKNDEVPLRGVLRCAECGRVLTAGNSKGRKKYYWYYLCETHRKNLPAAKLHQQFYEMLDLLSFSKERIEWFTEKITQGIQQQLGQRAEAIAQSQKALRSVTTKIETAEENYLTGDVSKASFNRVIAALRSQQIDIQRKILEQESDGQEYFDKLNSVLPKMHDIRRTLEQLDVAHFQQFVRLVFNDSLKHDGVSYRTAFLHPIFEHNALVLKEKGLLVIEQSLQCVAETPLSAPERSYIEPLSFVRSLYTIFSETA